MSTFAARARRITLRPLANADRLELASIDGTEYMVVCEKGLHQTGDLVIYIPEQAILTDALITELRLVSPDGKTLLAGGSLDEHGAVKRNRVKALRLRGTLSQGLVYRHTAKLGELVEGADYAPALGITKYAPPIPEDLLGKVSECPQLQSYTDLENIKNFPGVLQVGEPVIAVEKAHGVCTVLALIDGELAISGKGLAAKHLRLLDEPGPDGQPTNVYFRAAAMYDIAAKLRALAARYPGQIVTLFGETYGVQRDLKYGLAPGAVDFRAFDLRVGETYLPFREFTAACAELSIPTLPVIYQGPFDRALIEAAATGPEQVTGRNAHHREGVVVRPQTERRHPELGRVILKVISPKYLAKKTDTDTEYE